MVLLVTLHATYAWVLGTFFDLFSLIKVFCIVSFFIINFEAKTFLVTRHLDYAVKLFLDLFLHLFFRLLLHLLSTH